MDTGPSYASSRAGQRHIPVLPTNRIEQNSKLRDNLFIGTNKKNAITTGSHSQFPYANVLICRRRLRDDISAKQEKINFQNDNRKEIMSNDFGKESQKIVALIECECEKDFRGYLPQFKVGSVRKRTSLFQTF